MATMGRKEGRRAVALFHCEQDFVAFRELSIYWAMRARLGLADIVAD
jgi:hypothetical protein